MPATRNTARKIYSLTVAALLVTTVLGCGQSGQPAVEAEAGAEDNRVYRWKLVTTWPKNLPGLGLAPERLADSLREMSKGRVSWSVLLKCLMRSPRVLRKWAMARLTTGAARSR
jgi:TRAP-type mannitol/chloroaromatic compound transport system substrate-binding protein